MNLSFSLKLCKKEAKALLKKHWLSLPISVFFVLLIASLLGASLLFQALLEAVAGALHLEIPFAGKTAVAFFFFLAFFSFFCVPLWLGIKSVLFKCLFFGRSDFGDLFLFFSHRRRYSFAVKKAWRAILQLALILLLVFLIATLGASVAKTMVRADRPAAAMLILSVSLLFLVLSVLMYLFWRTDAFLSDVAFLFAPLLNFRQICALSARRMRTGRAYLFRLNLSFIPLFLISIPLLGIPLFALLPYYLSTRITLAYHLLYD